MKGICLGDAPEASGSNVDPMEFMMMILLLARLCDFYKQGKNIGHERQRYDERLPRERKRSFPVFVWRQDMTSCPAPGSSEVVTTFSAIQPPSRRALSDLLAPVSGTSTELRPCTYEIT